MYCKFLMECTKKNAICTVKIEPSITSVSNNHGSMSTFQCTPSAYVQPQRLLGGVQTGRWPCFLFCSRLRQEAFASNTYFLHKKLRVRNSTLSSWPRYQVITEILRVLLLYCYRLPMSYYSKGT